MTDPLSLIALGAAVGGAAGKFVEKAWDSGEKWITVYFADHRPKAIAQAQANSANFLNALAKRVKSLEDRGAVSKEQIESAQEHPDFSVALQKAMLTAAQTEDPQKHQLLARTLADRLGAKPEGMRAMASKIALDAIGYMTPTQLKLLGLIADLLYVNLNSPLPPPAYRHWFESRFSPYAALSFTGLDLLHLESLSCLKHTPIITRDLAAILSKKNSSLYEPAMLESPLGAHIKALWQQGLQAVDLSSVGQLVGVYVSDLLTGGNTSFTGWD
ncbi:MAG: hypothetical protein HZB55_10310 [Deltaproteobacteria bacterium]|nr:hypothetical protein [Deltaproteobacteria bacterium]